MDPYLTSNFLVEIDGIVRASFRQVSGLESSIEVVTLREGGALTPRKFPGLVQYPPLTLSYGMTEDNSLYEWFRRHETGDQAAERKGGSVILLDRSGAEVVRYNWVLGWPSKCSVSAFDAESTDIAMEMFEIQHEGLTKQ